MKKNIPVGHLYVMKYGWMSLPGVRKEMGIYLIQLSTDEEAKAEVEEYLVQVEIANLLL